jgi:signal transduction histidine kinase
VAELRRQTLASLFSKGQKHLYQEAMVVCRSAGVWRGELFIADSDPVVWLSVDLHSFGEQGVPPSFMLVANDITARKRIENDKTQFVAFVAHQLREPLVEMSWLSEQLLSEKLSAIARENLQMLHAAVLHETVFVRQLLDISRIERGILQIDIRPSSCSKLVADAVEPLRLKAADLKVDIIIEPIAEGLMVKADAGKLLEALRNIVDNAVKYTRSKTLVRVLVKQRGSEIDFQISDMGLGIPEQGDQRDRHSGAGLGLHFARRIVEIMHGRISFSTSATGTIFTITLPAA